jgi:hypothetical protein
MNDDINQNTICNQVNYFDIINREINWNDSWDIYQIYDGLIKCELQRLNITDLTKYEFHLKNSKPVFLKWDYVETPQFDKHRFKLLRKNEYVFDLVQDVEITELDKNRTILKTVAIPTQHVKYFTSEENFSLPIISYVHDQQSLRNFKININPSMFMKNEKLSCNRTSFDSEARQSLASRESSEFLWYFKYYIYVSQPCKIRLSFNMKYIYFKHEISQDNIEDVFVDDVQNFRDTEFNEVFRRSSLRESIERRKVYPSVNLVKEVIEQTIQTNDEPIENPRPIVMYPLNEKHMKTLAK